MQSILDKYDLLESHLYYDKAVELLHLISDKELEVILTTYPNLFSKLSNLTEENILKDKQAIKDAINIFIKTINARKLSKDKFNSMTLDEIKNYINSLIKVKNSNLLEIINKLEE